MCGGIGSWTVTTVLQHDRSNVEYKLQILELKNQDAIGKIRDTEGVALMAAELGKLQAELQKINDKLDKAEEELNKYQMLQQLMGMTPFPGPGTYPTKEAPVKKTKKPDIKKPVDYEALIRGKYEKKIEEMQIPQQQQMQMPVK